MNAGYVYVVAFSHGTVKVGQTTNLGSRLSTHRSNAKSFGVTVADWWASPLHAEWQQNEEALKVAARELGGIPASPEYFTGLDYAAIVTEGSRLTFTVPEFVRETQGRPTVRLRIPAFMKHAGARGLANDRAIAAHAGLDRTTVSRLLQGDISAGPRIIATILAAFPDRRFEDFFEVGITEQAVA